MIAAGHSGRVDIARTGLGDRDPDVQAAALGALARLGALTVDDVTRSLRTGAAPVRRRATDAALSVHGPGSRSTLYVAALGAIGDSRGLPAVLAALGDKPTVRRRATVALAGFDDPRVEPALRRSAEDRDWQVRQAADELIDEDG